MGIEVPAGSKVLIPAGALQIRVTAADETGQLENVERMTPRMLSVGARSDNASGGSFSLDRPSPNTTSESLAGGWVAELGAGSRQLIVRGPTAIDSYADALDEGLAAAQEALDLLAMRGGPLRVLEGSDANHIVWWTERRELILRLVRVEDLGVSATATTTVVDASGNPVPQPPEPTLVWHPSFRYFRLSQTTSDLFDSYRNLYLALEAVLSTVVPQRTRPDGTVYEGEGRWIRRALKEIDNTLPLARYAPTGSTNPVDGVLSDIYAGTRTGLFHAKSGRPVLLPHSGDNRPRVIQSLERLSQLYLDVARHYLAVRKPSSAMTYVGFDMATQFTTSAVVSDDSAPADSGHTVVNPTGGATATLSTRQAPEVSQPGLKFWLGEERARDIMARVQAIRRVALTMARDGTLLTVHGLDEPVSLDGVDVLQAQLGLRLVNLQQPRFRFNT